MRFRFHIAMLLSLGASMAAAAPADAIRASLAALNLPMQVQSISESPLDGIYQVQMDSGRIIYASADGQYLIQGALFDVAGGKLSNLTAAAESKAIGEALSQIPRDELVIFAPEEPKTHVTIFTDVDCGYCRLLHSEVDELNALGIEVRYAAFPRSGPTGESAQTMQSIWCAKDQQEAMTEAKLGNSIAQATCTNPVAKQYELGMQMGVQGTPAIFLANGTLVPGYKPAKVLAEEALANQ
ncbi:bifunctional protein-disulfide isomerase/oxidoreductase DsbC [Halopseudomonas sp.]|jgi:thiol:disulfide interchange protein DsbC|uniref:bifunctional protein-disulfide isomerase/oxidoreductase DsbC n=1 Tax=Halopseudomonas sp. TaxID=2901191 RepID=UPI001A410E81|nr:bifunctional protein-disulfide isomerase/oxidoreductase DsbC [Pseudomonas sp.]